MIDPDKMIESDRATSTKDAQEALNKNNKKLVEEMFYVSIDCLFHPEPDKRISKTMALFSALLVNLSEQAEKTAKTIKYLTWALLAFTVALLFIGIIQIKVAQNSNANSNTDQTKDNNGKIQTNQTRLQSVQPLPPSPVIPEKKQINNQKTTENEAKRK